MNTCCMGLCCLETAGFSYFESSFVGIYAHFKPFVHGIEQHLRRETAKPDCQTKPSLSSQVPLPGSQGLLSAAAGAWQPEMCQLSIGALFGGTGKF